ncbi:MAG: RNA polymerase sigma factor [Candidatus Marinimicrobia bacterium]|nr:RNA polymerase sigma factor [Candidatus Neomarinimicrobiota bacterium]MDD5583197.1 RNA polymerase sigma factor [Candidatus Neomarinimicrobiota bacterium]
MRKKEQFEHWLKEYYDMIYTTIIRITGNEDDTQDLVQDVFLTAWEKMYTFRGESSPGTWLRRIAMNKAYNFVQRNQVGRWNEFDEGNFKNLTDDNDEKLPDFKEKWLQSLSPLERSVIIARMDGLTYKEIAVLFSTTENSAKVSYHKGVQKLKKVLA